jgi:hypothetical protein
MFTFLHRGPRDLGGGLHFPHALLDLEQGCQPAAHDTSSRGPINVPVSNLQPGLFLVYGNRKSAP